jgi:MFS family permease
MKIVTMFKQDFWLICALAVLEKASIQPFINNAIEMLHTKFNLARSTSKEVYMGTYLILFIVVGIPLGWITDKRGKKGYVMIAGFALLFMAHLIFVNFDDCEVGDQCYKGILPMTLIGLSNTMI